MTRLVCGLGNPGPRYAGTRHNLGFMVLDRLARHEGLIFESLDSLEDYAGPRSARCARALAHDALLVLPETFMNRSGEVVAPLVRWSGAATEDLLVVYDDLDLDFGRMRLRPHGGTGGHRGMDSIVGELGSDRFPRLRLGVGPRVGDAADFVLAEFRSEEADQLDRTLGEACDAILYWMREGDIEKCMTRFHERWNPGAVERDTGD